MVQTQRENMIKQQLRTGDVLDERLLNLYQDIPRDAFVPTHLRHFAYSDMQIHLPHDQRMMTPLEEALLLKSLRLSGKETVLEIGTGTGFLTTMLSRLCHQVITIDYYAEFTDLAKQNLQPFQCNNVEFITGDASQGWVGKAPYDVIVFTSGLEKLSDTIRLQVLPGGKLFTIIGKLPIMQGQVLRLDHQHNWSLEVVFETCLPPLIDNLKTDVFIF